MSIGGILLRATEIYISKSVIEHWSVSHFGYQGGIPKVLNAPELDIDKVDDYTDYSTEERDTITALIFNLSQLGAQYMRRAS